MTRRKYRGTAYWAGIALIAAGVYVALFGPVVWFSARGHLRRSTVAVLYWPILWQSVRGPRPMSTLIQWWGSVGVATGHQVRFEIENLEGGISYADFPRP